VATPTTQTSAELERRAETADRLSPADRCRLAADLLDTHDTKRAHAILARLTAELGATLVLPPRPVF